MKICYIDLGINKWEDYSLNPKRYGGGAVFARYAKEELNKDGNTFHIYASRECFDNLTSLDNRDACKALDDSVLEAFKNGMPISNVIPNGYDLYVHHHDCLTLNMAGIKAPLVHWSLMGDGGANHPNTPHSLLYLKNQKANYGQTHYITLGKPIPAFQGYPKQDYVFQCTRHDGHMNSIPVAAWCNLNNVKGFFAGPIFNGYNLLDYIDNVNTFYVGSISDSEKNAYYKGARLCTFDFQWDPPFNQSIIEALSYGTPVYASRRGFLSEIVKEGVNGFFSDNNDLTFAYENAPFLKQKDIYNTATKYNVENMISSFKSAFETIIK